MTIGDADEQAFITRTFLPGDKAWTDWYWIGLSELPGHWLKGENGKFRWNNDERVTFVNWAPGCPADPSPADSAAMNYARAAGSLDAPIGTWTDVSNERVRDPAGRPTLSHPAIIEFDAPPPSWLLVTVARGFEPPGHRSSEAASFPTPAAK